MGEPGGAGVHGDHSLVDEHREYPFRVRVVAHPAEKLVQRDGRAARRQVVGYMHETEEQPSGKQLLGGVKALVGSFGGPGERFLDPAAGQVVGNRQGAAVAVFPGGQQRVRQHRQGTRLVRSVDIRDGCQVGQ